MCDKNHDVIKTENFKQTLLKSGLKKNDNRLYSLFQMLDTFGKEIYYDDFIKIISSAGLLVEKALRGELALPDFSDFSKNMDEMVKEVTKNKAGEFVYEKQTLTKEDQEQYVIDMVTVDVKVSKKDEIDYGKIGTGKYGLGTSKSEIDAEFKFDEGSVGLARSLKYDTEDSQFFIILDDEPLFEGEYTPIGKVIYGIQVLEKIKYSHRSEYVLRPDFVNTVRMFE